MVAKVRGVVLPLAVALFASAAMPAHAQRQIISGVESEYDGDGPEEDKQVSTTPGAVVSTTWGGADTRALTDYGVNKIHAKGTDDAEQYASSLWLDTFTVGGSGASTITLKFAIDGNASFGSDGEFNYNVFALRGSGWSAGGMDGASPSQYGAAGFNADYDSMLLQLNRPNGTIGQVDARYFDGIWNYTAANPSGVRNFGGNTLKGSDERGVYYDVRTPVAGLPPSFTAARRYYATGSQPLDMNGDPTGQYADYPAGSPLQQTYANIASQYFMLDMAQLCAGESCEAGNYPGSELTLSFTLAAGEKFTLVSWLFADDVFNGTVDFFNTAKMTGLTATDAQGNNLAVTSESGALVPLPNGQGFGFPAALAAVGAVPEPSTWAMMIIGFGAAGAALRRLRRPVLAAA